LFANVAARVRPDLAGAFSAGLKFATYWELAH
jgi:hypothetical protein